MVTLIGMQRRFLRLCRNGKWNSGFSATTSSKGQNSFRNPRIHVECCIVPVSCASEGPGCWLAGESRCCPAPFPPVSSTAAARPPSAPRSTPTWGSRRPSAVACNRRRRPRQTTRSGIGPRAAGRAPLAATPFAEGAAAEAAGRATLAPEDGWDRRTAKE